MERGGREVDANGNEAHARHSFFNMLRSWLEKMAMERAIQPSLYFNILQIASFLKDAAALSTHFLFEDRALPAAISVPKEWSRGAFCYMCKLSRRRVHGIYLMCCNRCGNINFHMLKQQHDPALTAHAVGMSAFVTGGRTKIGFQVALRLLRAGAVVMISSRFPQRAIDTYRREKDASKWIDRLHVYPKGLDFNHPAHEVARQLQELVNWTQSAVGLRNLDVLFNIAAQTIRGIERHQGTTDTFNRYGDAAHFPEALPNSWQLLLGEIEPLEVEEVFRINATAPLLTIQAFLPLMLKSVHPRRCVVNAHAREGLFHVKRKSALHLHTNMAKSALHQLTLMVNRQRFPVEEGAITPHRSSIKVILRACYSLRVDAKFFVVNRERCFHKPMSLHRATNRFLNATESILDGSLSTSTTPLPLLLKHHL